MGFGRKKTQEQDDGPIVTQNREESKSVVGHTVRGGPHAAQPLLSEGGDTKRRDDDSRLG